MCGIWGSIGKPHPKPEYYINKITGRGPEGKKLINGNGYQLGFTRLAINGLNESGMQPMSFGSSQWVCNGEIYNWKELSQKYGVKTESGSDCEVLGELFSKLAPDTDGATFFRSLDGVFAYLYADNASGTFWVARDPYGVRPLFVGYVLGDVEKNPTDMTKRYIAVKEGVREVESIVFSSEIKGLVPRCEIVEAFPPGHYAVYSMKTLERIGFESYHTVPWLKNPLYESENQYNAADASTALSFALERAVEKRMLMERPVAALLSGGIDSSLIAALVQRQCKMHGLAPLKTFSIGFEGSEDLRYARMVADHIKSDHHEIILTPDNFFDAVPEVIESIESYDITTVRASVGNWLVSKAIREKTDCKVVFNGDGSDEVFGSYLYFYNAPSDAAFEYESGRLLKDIHYFDVLRSDRCISSHGLEPRTPFLDKQFVAVARSIGTSLRRPMKNDKDRCEKWILRKAFDGLNLLPKEVLWRRKEAFSDGVSGKEKSWYEICQEKTAEIISADELETLKKLKHLPPQTAEAAYYRRIFRLKFGNNVDAVTVPYHWMPKWCGDASDPSARTLKVYEEEKDKENKNS